MTIISELAKNVFAPDSDFLPKLAKRWPEIKASFLHCAGDNPEPAFLDLFTEQIFRSSLNYEIFTRIRLDEIHELSGDASVERILGMELSEIMDKICLTSCTEREWSVKCFGGAYKGTDIDCLIRGNGRYCLLEYEEEYGDLCDNFMKMYRLKELLKKEFESLFVTRLTTKSLEKFDSYMDKVEPILNKLLGKEWAVLVIVDLKGKQPSFHWRLSKGIQGPFP